MPKAPSFRVSNTKSGWRVNVPASISDTGKDQRRFFPSRQKASDFASDLRKNHGNHGRGFSVLPPRVADDALMAWRILEPLGITLTQAAREAEARHVAAARSESLGVALDAWKLAIENRGLRDKTRKGYELTVGLLRSIGAGTVLTSVKGDQVAAAIAGKSYDYHRRNASAFFHWCAKSPRKWCDPKAIMGDVESFGNQRDGEIGTLTPDDCEALMRTAEAHFPETVCMYAVSLFGGLRKEELGKLEKEVVRPTDGIEVCAAIAKKGRRRFVPMNETLTAWLEAYPFDRCSNWIEKDKAVRRLAGWEVESRLIDNPQDPTRGKWPRNALRPTHASVEIANGATLEDLLFRFGHTDKGETLRSHYVGRYTKKDAERLLAMRPEIRHPIRAVTTHR